MMDTRRIAVLLACLAFGLPRIAAAGYLQIVSAHDVTVDAAANTILCKFTIGNTGDETAKEVGIEVPDLNEHYPAFPTLDPGERKTTELRFTFAQVGIALPGSYLLPYRITYKDGNFHPFSAPNLLEVALPPAPARTVAVQFEGMEPGAPIELSGTQGVTLALRNLSSGKIEVTGIKAFTAAEIVGTIAGVALPVVLEPQDKRQITLTLENVAGLAGSNYPAGVVVTGTTDGRHFAEASRVQVQITDSALSVRNLFRVALVLLVVGSLGYWLLTGRRSTRR
jgi:hypothetical protein